LPSVALVSKRRLTVSAQLRRSNRRSSDRNHAALVGAPQTGVQPEIVQPERNPAPDRAEASEEDGRAAKDENQGKFLDPDVEQATYVASQETPERKEELEQEAFNRWSNASDRLYRRSMLRKISNCLYCTGSNGLLIYSRKRNNDGFLLLVCLV
jgi:hypothetical protein